MCYAPFMLTCAQNVYTDVIIYVFILYRYDALGEKLFNSENIHQTFKLVRPSLSLSLSRVPPPSFLFFIYFIFLNLRQFYFALIRYSMTCAHSNPKAFFLISECFTSSGGATPSTRRNWILGHSVDLFCDLCEKPSVVASKPLL